MVDRSEILEEGDFHRFRKITVIARNSKPKGRLVGRSGNHRQQVTTHENSRCIIDQQWEIIN